MKVLLSSLFSIVLVTFISISLYSSNIKIFISESVYPLIYDIPLVGRELHLARSVYLEQQRKHEGLVHYVIDNFTDYSINYYDLPFPSYRQWRSKPTAYLEQTVDKIIIASGAASFLYINKEDIDQGNVIFNSIDSNIRKVITDDKFYRSGSTSIKDLKIIDNFLYLSYTKKLSDKCYNVSVLRSKVNFQKFEFEEVFSPEECLDHNYRKQNGGRLFPYKNGKLLLSIGIMDNHLEAQNKDTMFGKIVSFSPLNNEYEILSMGHRNPQGLYYDAENDVILNTEHQSLGGDEVNINIAPNPKNIKNYGWPISSYGSHYGRRKIEGQPLHDSHSDYGFVEPSIYFTPSLGISQIVKAPKDLSVNNSNDYFVSSMGYGVSEGGDMSLHHLRYDSNYSKVELYDTIPIGERIRDLEFLQGSTDILLILESTPAFAILKKKNYSCDKNNSPCHYDKKYILIDQTDPLNVVRESYEKLLP